jgi:cyclopropane fatty-acyl-phospholipid synthase-like methyltransferase
MDMTTLGAQLRCPSGEFAQEVSDRMFASNLNMIQKTYQNLNLEKATHLLELGFGNGRHLREIMENFPALTYTGVDISDDMVRMAQQFMKENHLQKVQLHRIEKSFKEFVKDPFDACMTVNTLYFLEDPLQTFKDIVNGLTSHGTFAMGCIEKEFGQHLPFTQQHFTFYDERQIKDWLVEAGFNTVERMAYTEMTLAKEGQWIERPFEVYVCTK